MKASMLFLKLTTIGIVIGGNAKIFLMRSTSPKINAMESKSFEKGSNKAKKRVDGSKSIL